MGMTIAEKILAKKGGQAKVVPGDVVTVGVDVVVLFDNNFMPSIWREMKSYRSWVYIVTEGTGKILPANSTLTARATSQIGGALGSVAMRQPRYAPVDSRPRHVSPRPVLCARRFIAVFSPCS